MKANAGRLGFTTMPRSSKAKSGTIDQTVVFSGVSPHQVYETLLDSTQHAAFTGGEALISRRTGGAFTTFDGWATGKNIKLKADQLIVQTWRTEDWPADAISICTYQLAAVPNGTKLVFHQVDVPAAFMKTIAQGWREYYWRPMQKLFDRSRAASE